MDKASRFSELIRQQQESGLTIKDFCFNQGIALSTFHYWHKKLRRHNSEKGFIPLIVKSADADLHSKYRKGSRQAIASHGSGEDMTLLELIFPNGTLLRVKKDLDLEHLRALIHLYD